MPGCTSAPRHTCPNNQKQRKILNGFVSMETGTILRSEILILFLMIAYAILTTGSNFISFTYFYRILLCIQSVVM